VETEQVSIHNRLLIITIKYIFTASVAAATTINCQYSRFGTRYVLVRACSVLMTAHSALLHTVLCCIAVCG
jgi:hypothetical protein